MKRMLMIIGLVLILATALGCGTPGNKVGTQPPPPPPPPPPPLVVDLSAGTWTLTAYNAQGNYGTLTLNLVKSGNCPGVAPGTSFVPTKCYQAEQSWAGSFTANGLFGGCYQPTGIIVGQDANNNVQFRVDENDENQNPGKDVYGYGLGTITSKTASGGSYSTPCGSQTISVQWSGYFN